MPSTRDFSPFVPFDLYDFFGYLFPGIIFAISLTLFYGQIKPSLLSDISSSLTINGEVPFIIGLAIVIGAIVTLYTLGHFIATLSHMIIDRVLIDGIEGYPVNFLLGIPRPRRPFSESTFKYIFAMYNFLLLIPFFIPDFQVQKKIVITLLSLIALLIILRIIILIVKHFIGPEKTKRFGDKAFFQLYLIPSKYIIDPCIIFLRRLLGLNRKFPDSFIKLYERLFTNRFGNLQPKDVDSENYWLPVFSVKTQNEVHDRTLHTWLHLYGYARNASAALYISSSLIMFHLFFNPGSYDISIRIQLGILWFIAAIMGTRYWILYSHYYTKGVIRAFVEHETNQERNQ